MDMSDWLFPRPTGEYYCYEVPNSRESYDTFIPNLLCNDLDIKVDAELTNLLSTAHRLLGQLEGMSSFLPNADAVKSIILYKEALLSCQVDGINAPLYDILDSSRKEYKKIAPIKEYVSAMRYGLGKLDTTHYKNSLLCEIHSVLMNEGETQERGKFRTKQTLIGNVAMSNMPIYNPTSPDKLTLVLHDLEKFVRRKNDFDAIIKAAHVHYQFETIHPFMSGNGRVGRILSYLILKDKKILAQPVVCLSHYLNINKVEYFDRLERLHHIQDYEQWIKFFIRAVIFSADASLENIKGWLRIRNQNLSKIEKSKKPIRAIIEVFNVIEQHPIFDINTVAEKAGISYNTGAAAVRMLNDLGIVKQSNDMTRNRDYAFTEFLNCFVGEDMLSQSDMI